MFHLQLLLFALTAAADRPRSSNATVTLGKLMNDTAKFWDAFRDPTTGLYCDHFAFDTSDAGDRSPSSLPHEAGSSCAAAIAAECSGKPSATQCDACAAQHQQELRGAGCTSVEIRQWCAAAAAPLPVCQGKQYSIAACGMGLIATAAFAEMELLSRQEAEKRALQTLSSLATKWPKESFSGFFNHFTNAPDFEPTAEYSTVDTAEMAMGALFAGNYFGGSVQSAAAALVHGVKWTVAIEADGGPTTFPIINGTTGVPIGNIRPYNEYFILAYLAKIMEDQQGGGGGGGGGRANKYWNTYFASTGEGGTGAPAGRAGYPAHASYEGHALLTDNPNRHFMSSFIPQFCFFQTKYFQESSYYAQKLFPAWLAADMAYWQSNLNSSSTIWGHQVQNKIFGCGAGASPPHKYGVDRITDAALASATDGVFSAAIMAGFLGATAPDSAERERINTQLHWLYSNEVCLYPKTLPSGETVKVLWRCSVNLPEWRAAIADSIDFSTMVLGLAINFLPEGFYRQYAA